MNKTRIDFQPASFARRAGIGSLPTLLCAPLLLAMLATGCGSTPGPTYSPPPATELETPPQLPNPDTQAGEGTTTESDTTSDNGASGDPASNNAALVLLAQSETLRSKGELPGAVALVERAIRLEPRRSDLWIQLARLRYDNSELDAAEQHATRAIALSREDSTEHRQGWLLLAEIAHARGDKAGAEQIRSRWLNKQG